MEPAEAQPVVKKEEALETMVRQQKQRAPVPPGPFPFPLQPPQQLTIPPSTPNSTQLFEQQQQRHQQMGAFVPQQQQQTRKRRKQAALCCPIVYGSIAFWLGNRGDEFRTHEWTLFVRGPKGEDVSYFLEKVVFKLHPSFARPIREVTSPPFEVTEKGWGEFEAAIRLHFKDPTERPVELAHVVKLYDSSSTPQPKLAEPVAVQVYDEIVFSEPHDDFYRALVEDDKTQEQPHPLREYFRVFDDSADLEVMLRAAEYVKHHLDAVKDSIYRLDHQITVCRQMDANRAQEAQKLRQLQLQQQQHLQQQQQAQQQASASAAAAAVAGVVAPTTQQGAAGVSASSSSSKGHASSSSSSSRHHQGASTPSAAAAASQQMPPPPPPGTSPSDNTSYIIANEPAAVQAASLLPQQPVAPPSSSSASSSKQQQQQQQPGGVPPPRP